MAKKIELLHTTYDESGNIESQEVVHPLTSPNCIIMENGKTLDEVMGDGIATPTLTHEGTSFKVGVGDSNIEVVDGDVAGMTLKGQSYQNILPKPTTLIMETDEKEFKINDKIDSNIIIDDNIAEIATVKGQTYVNVVQEESASEYVAIDEELSGQSIVHVKETPTLEGSTLINIQPKTTFIVGANPIHIAWANNNVTQRPQPNKKYFIKLYNLPKCVNQVYLAEVIQYLNDKDYAIITPSTDDSVSYNKLHIYADTLIGYIQPSELNTIQALVCEYIDGMENWDIPYFEGEKYFESNIKGVTLQGQTLVNTIQEPCEDDYVVLGAEDGIEIGAETGGHGTIEDTVQGGINGAVLEGMTLVNLIDTENGYGMRFTHDGTVDGDCYTVTTMSHGQKVVVNQAPSGWRCFVQEIKLQMLKPSTKYFVSGEFQGISSFQFMQVDSLKPISMYGDVINNRYAIIKTDGDLYENITSQCLYGHISSNIDSGSVLMCNDVILVEYQEGMENWDIPYFESMKSVQMPVVKTTGKNLFDIDKCKPSKTINDNGNEVTSADPNHYAYGEFIPINNEFTMSLTSNNGSVPNNANGTRLRFYDENKNLVDSQWFSQSFKESNGRKYRTISMNGAKYLKINFSATGGHADTTYEAMQTIQIEEGSTVTSFEPFKSNILTVNEEVELRGIGDVKDELDLLIGKLTQKIGEVVLDGSQTGWSIHPKSDETYTIFYGVDIKEFDSADNYFVWISDKFVNLGVWNDMNSYSQEYLTFHVTKPLIKLKNTTLSEISVNGLNTYLSQNPITVQYQLAQSTIKTVDLSIVDQDGNTIPHIQTQPTVTHITASSDYLIPTVTIDSNLAYDTIIKPSTLYTVRFKHDTVNADNPLTVDLGGTTQTVTSTEFTITTPSTLTHNQLVFSGKNNVVSEVQVIEGDMTNIEYPFFEGMNDVKFSDSKFIARGKNLLHVGKGYGATDINGLTVIRNEVEQTITINGTCTLNNTSCALAPFYREFKKGETYAFSCKLISGTADKILFRINDEQWKGNMSCGLNATSSNIYETSIKTFYSDETYDRSSIRVDNGATFNNAVFKVMLEKISVVDDYTLQYEPYKGVEVQQDVDSILLTSDMFEQKNIVSVTKGMSYQQASKTTNTARICTKTIIPIKPNAKYVINNIPSNIDSWYHMFDKNGGFITHGGFDEQGGNGLMTNNAHYMAMVIRHTDNSAISPSDLDSMNLILQEVPQEIVLRGIGDVKDELDLTRGEYIQRIGEIVLDGKDSDDLYHTKYSINSHETNTFTNTSVFCIWGIPNKKSGYNTSIANSFSNCGNASSFTPTLAKQGTYSDHTELQNIYIDYGNNNNYTLKDFKAYLQKNPITLQYQLETPIIHKVNLTNTKVIPSYATETHYETITPSDSLIPNITIPSTLNYDVAIKPSTEYTIRANTSDNLTVDLGGATGTLSNGKVTLTTPATLTHNEVKFSGTGKVKEVMVVEGNEIKDNVPFFNGMKNVEMGGIKLVNIARGANCVGSVTANANKTQFTYTNSLSTDDGTITFAKELVKPNTLYTVYCKIPTNTINKEIKIQIGDGETEFLNIPINYTGIYKTLLTSPQEIKHLVAFYFRSSSTLGQVVIENPMVIEGDWTHLDEIPFIESEMIIEQPIIRSQGKNLFDVNKLVQDTNGSHFNSGGYRFPLINFKVGKIYTISVSEPKWIKIGEFSGGVTIVENLNTTKLTITMTNDILKSYIMVNNNDFSVITDVEWLRNNVQIEEGSSATTYEPYKHQTLYSNRVIGYEKGIVYQYTDGASFINNTMGTITVNVEGLFVAYVSTVSSHYSFWDKDGAFISGKQYLDSSLSLSDKNGFIAVPSNAKYMKCCCIDGIETEVAVTGELPLRSLPNGVCDTLNLVTGEYVQRVGEVVLDGSEGWTSYNKDNFTNVYGAYTSLANNTKPHMLEINNDTLPSRIGSTVAYYDEEGIYCRNDLLENGALYVKINKEKLETQDLDGFKQYLSQNPVTVQYELATPIVRKLGFTTKGNYREQVLDGSETWAMDAIDNNKTVRMTKKTVSPLQNALYDTVLFTDDYHVRASGENHATYEYITCIGNSIYINIYQSKVSELSVQGCTQWLSHNPIKVGYITSTQSSESYNNIHKPIFFNDVDVQYLPNNVDIQPKLTYQARTRNSYVMDMMKANTKYSIKTLSSDGVALIDSTQYTLANNRTFVSPSTLTNKELIILGQWHEPMIIEGDVTGKNLPYFKGILSSYHDVDEVEIYSATNNIFDGKMELGLVTDGGLLDSENAIRTVNYIKVKPSTIYYIGCDKKYRFATYYYDKNYRLISTSGANVNDAVTTPSNCEYMKFRTSADAVQNDLTAKFWVNEKTLLEYSPYAHSTTLIEMPTRLETVKVVRPELTEGALEITNGAECASTTEWRSNFIPVQPSEFIKVKNGSEERLAHIDFYDVNKNFISYSGVVNATYVPNNCYFIRFFMSKSNCSDLTITRQAWKPIQLNSLPNGVCDEIIMKPNSNKAQLVQRVGKVVLDGCDYTFGAPAGEVEGNDVMCKYIPYTDGKNGGLCISDRFLTPTYSNEYTNIETIMFGTNTIIMSIRRARTNSTSIEEYLKDNPITVYYELATPIIHEIQLKGYPTVYKDGTVTLNTDTPHQTIVSYNVNQEQLINTQNETIIRHDQQIDDLYYYIEMYLEEIYQMELFRMKLELSL